VNKENESEWIKVYAVCTLD